MNRSQLVFLLQSHIFFTSPRIKCRSTPSKYVRGGDLYVSTISKRADPHRGSFNALKTTDIEDHEKTSQNFTPGNHHENRHQSWTWILTAKRTKNGLAATTLSPTAPRRGCCLRHWIRSGIVLLTLRRPLEEYHKSGCAMVMNCIF